MSRTIGSEINRALHLRVEPLVLPLIGTRRALSDSIVKGSAYEPTPWRAVQRAAREALYAI